MSDTVSIKIQLEKLYEKLQGMLLTQLSRKGAQLSIIMLAQNRTRRIRVRRVLFWAICL